jgi:hypothetical protein
MEQTLLQQNPWLRDPVIREQAWRIAAASSSAVEGIRKPFTGVNKPISGSLRALSGSAQHL